ncbi:MULTISPECIES: alpha/beta hydrolase family protein [Flavobacterium]|uniref:alpha/beta hydrolase family protein n=1 Tax=Flavobacterium TaxID=237 RepID=UPI001FCC77D9|nr:MULTISPECIES: alpha/beta fold hydrolase [Flavobacterium]UOK41713.1 alpha/beta fold hydrolase [Flavobacterium enshiense]
MKPILTLFLSLITIITASAQDITGQWNGVLKVQGTQLRLVFHITKSGNGFTSTMDSPDQGATGIPTTSTSFENSKLKIEVTNARIEYSGEFKEGEIIGTFKQSGYEFPMNLSRKPIEKETIKRPQEPVTPYPYYTEDITFSNPKANISLAGTLSLPKKEGNFPVVILITGSGPQNRNEELLGHKPFLVISDYLTKNGIAVLRYDDRGIGQSKGDFKTATSADFATDVESAIAYLKTRKEINKKKIGLMGHSEGGLIAPMIASKSKDVDFIVLLAGTGIQGDKLLLLQQELIGKAAGASETDIQKTYQNNKKIFEMVIKSTDDEKLKSDVKQIIKEMLKNDPTAEIPSGMSEDEFISVQVEQITSPWMLYFLRFDPSTTLEIVKCPVLAVNGEKDLQVPAKVNLSAIENSLKKGGNKKVTVKEFPNLNHLFQECKTGSPSEYAEIEQTFSPVALEEITKWILNQTK